MNRPVGRDSGPGAGRGRGLAKPQTRKGFPPSQNGGKKGSDDIQLLHTDTLIKEVSSSILISIAHLDVPLSIFVHRLANVVRWRGSLPPVVQIPRKSRRQRKC